MINVKPVLKETKEWVFKPGATLLFTSNCLHCMQYWTILKKMSLEVGFAFK